MKKTSAIWLLIIFLTAVIVRGLTLLAPDLWTDELIVGLMSLHVTQGEFPVFFYGQNFMGSLEAYLGGALFQLIGLSPFTLELLPALLSLLFIYLQYQLAKKFFRQQVALLCILLLAIPPLFLLRWTHEVRPHYPLTMVFGNLLLYLSHHLIYRSPSSSGKKVLYLVLGLIAGIGWWTNYLIITFILPVGLFMFLDNKKIIFNPSFYLCPVMFLIGSSPLWLYNYLHQFPITGIINSGPASNFMPYLRDLFTNALPILLGFLPPLHQDKVDLAGYLLIGPIYAAAVLYYLFRFRKNLRSIFFLRLQKSTSGDILIFVLGLNVLLHLATNYGSRLSDNDQKYFLPLYSCLPVFVSLFLVRVKEKSFGLFSLFLVLILFFNLAGIIRHDGLTILNRAKYQIYNKDQKSEARLTDYLISNGYDRLYFGGGGKNLILKSSEALIVAQPYQENYLRYVDQVDAARKPAYLSQGQDPVFEENMKAIGGSYQKKIATDGYLLYADFKPPSENYKRIPHDLWKGTSNLNPGEARNAFDGDISTGWGTRKPQNQGDYYFLDLGKIETVGKISYIPASYRHVPLGYQVAASLDGKDWQILAQVRHYKGPIFWSGPTPLTKVRRGRVEAVFPPRPCRFIKISLLHDSPEYHWSINELFLFTPEREKHKVPSPDEAVINQVLNFLTTYKIDFVYTNHWLSAVIRVQSKGKIKTPISNFFNGNNGEMDPEPDQFLTAHLDRKVAVVIEVREENELEKTLREAKWEFKKQAIEPYVLFYDFSNPAPQNPLSEKNWQVSSNANPHEVGKAIDRKPLTRWTSGKPQEPGVYYQIDLKTVQSIKGCALLLGKSVNDYPRSLRLVSSLDGDSWQEIKTTAESGLYWTGETLLKMTRTRFFFSPVQLRYLRLVQEGQDPVYYWSIHELELF